MKSKGLKIISWVEKPDADSACRFLDSRKAHRKSRWLRKYNRILDRIASMKSAEAMASPPIVQCSECRYGTPCRNGRGERAIECNAADFEPICHPPTWYCADGEWR